MTKQETLNVRALQIKGYGYKKIAKTLGIPLSTVKSYCRRNPISEMTTEAQESAMFCKNCGAVIEHTPKKKEKVFCSDKCRSMWWNKHNDALSHRTVNKKVCAYCGKEFVYYRNRERIYCSRECSSNARRKVEI